MRHEKWSNAILLLLLLSDFKCSQTVTITSTQYILRPTEIKNKFTKINCERIGINKT